MSQRRRNTGFMGIGEHGNVKPKQGAMFGSIRSGGQDNIPGGITTPVGFNPSNPVPVLV